MKSPRQERKGDREEKLLKGAKKVASSQGFLAMKVTDVALAARVSIGTLYSHFESKEDLILALAIESCRERVIQVERMLSDEFLAPTDRLLAAIFVDFLFHADHPDFFAVEQLAATPSVLDRASARRLREMEMLHKQTWESIAKGIRLAIEEGGFSPWDDRQEQAKTMERGIWALMIGCPNIWYATRRLGADFSADVLIPDFVKHNCRALFCGYGWQSTTPDDEITRLATYSLLHGRKKTIEEKAGKGKSDIT